APPTAKGAGGGASSDVSIATTGVASATAPTGHIRVPVAAFASDIYRVTITVDGAGWQADVQNAVVAVKVGESVRVPVFVRRATGTAASAKVTVTVASESDPTKRATTVT